MNRPRDVTAIVLAGGASSRFGGDKLAIDLGGRPLLHHALEAVALVADRIVVVIAPGAPEPAAPRSLASRIAIARDPAAYGGPLAGLAAGLAAVDLAAVDLAAVGPAVRDDPPRIVLVVGGDMPGLVPAVLRLLADRLGAEEGLAAMTLDASPSAPLPLAIRPGAARDGLAACLASGRRSLRSLLEAVPSATVPAADWRAIDPSAATLRDIDTRGDLDTGDLDRH